MKIDYHPNPDKGVTHLMYVGDVQDDKMGADGLGATPWAERGPKIAAAGVLLGLVLWVAFKKR